MVPIGEPQDVDAGRRARRQPLEDVGRQIAVGIDDRRPDRRLREREDEVEQERALAGSGRAEDREMAGEGVRGQGERAAAALAEHEPEAPVLARWRGTERTGAGKARAVERSVGQVPQLRELPVREPGGRRCPAGATPDLPADRLPAVVELGGEVRQTPQERLCGVGGDAGDLEAEADVEPDDTAALAVRRLALGGRAPNRLPGPRGSGRPEQDRVDDRAADQ